MHKCVDPNCGVKEGYFRGVWHCFGRKHEGMKTQKQYFRKKIEVKIEKNPQQKFSIFFLRLFLRL